MATANKIIQVKQLLTNRPCRRCIHCCIDTSFLHYCECGKQELIKPPKDFWNTKTRLKMNLDGTCNEWKDIDNM
jgi:hypothetical protein